MNLVMYNTGLTNLPPFLFMSWGIILFGACLELIIQKLLMGVKFLVLKGNDMGLPNFF